MSLLLIRITCPSQRIANSIAEAAIEQRLAACANVDGPVMATYRWKGVIEQAWEFVLSLKAPEANFSKIETLVKDLHPYDVPTITGMPCTHSSREFSDWVSENTET